VSKQKPQLTTKRSVTIHCVTCILHVDPRTHVSKKAKRDKRKDEKIANVDKKQEP
jgi:hypothetical protein